MSIIAVPERVRQMDRDAIAAGTPGFTLMTRAAHALVLEILRYAPGRRIGLYCGGGNNGGDALVSANELMKYGLAPTIVLLADPEALKGDARLAWEKLSPVVPVCRALPAGPFDLVVDALLGTGLDRPVEGRFAEAVNEINGAGVPVIAVDIPSGVDGRTGQVLGTAVRASRTVTFAVEKPGLLYEPGRSLAGIVRCADIGLPLPGDGWLKLDADSVSGRLPARPAAGHKGTFGHLAVLAGSGNMMGAGALCSAAGLRAGAGLVSWGYAEGGVPRGLWEVMAKPLGTDGESAAAFLAGKTAAALGPGLGRNCLPWVDAALESGLPLVVDADALNALEGDPGHLRGVRGVMTPHPAEAARLLNASVAEVVKDAPAAALALARESGLTAVLKGAVTTVASPDGHMALNTAGNAGMATGGSGDVLTGMIGGLLAQGLAPSDAAECGVYLHALAGDAAAQAGSAGLIASDMVKALPGVIRQLSGQ